MNKLYILLMSLVLPVSAGFAAKITVDVYKTNETNEPVGKVVFEDTPYGLMITPELSSLPPGPRGFHLHQNPDCSERGEAAGGHYDPKDTKAHQGPYQQGHAGDLPILYVNQDGKANIVTIAPRLKTSDLKNRALVIHAGGDTYSDTPHLGGGGARIACGVIK